MTNPEARSLQALLAATADFPEVAVAVSGGVDSMTLAVALHRARPDRMTPFHAVSPAVPPRATRRVERYAAREGWALQVIDAGEFADPSYRENPVNRCYFCKMNLYTAIVGRTRAVVLSGTNCDDLADYRPGLAAAKRNRVRHPYVEAGLDKAAVRRLARFLDLPDLAELPAAPCLSSRVETGLAIEGPALAAIDAAEERVRLAVSPSVVRCRLRRAAIEVELDAATLARLGPSARRGLAAEVAALFADAGIGHEVSFAPYRQGSAFLREDADG